MTSAQPNPFSSLFNDKTEYVVRHPTIESIFLFTLRPSTSSAENVLNLANYVDVGASVELGTPETILGQALFERLLLAEPADYLAEASKGATLLEATERRSLIYLHDSYRRCFALKADKSDHTKERQIIKDLIIRNVCTAMQQPEVLPEQSLSSQWLDILKDSADFDENVLEFLVSVVSRILEDLGPSESMEVLKSIFSPMLDELVAQISKFNLVSVEQHVFSVLRYFTTDKRAAVLGELLIKHTTPPLSAAGGEYMKTLFGALLSISILPKRQSGPFEYFRNVASPLQNTDNQLWQLLATHQRHVYELIMRLMHISPTARHLTLEWLGNCLHANVGRGQLWSNIRIEFGSVLHQNVSDAFMCNLCGVLMLVCGPLCPPTNKILLVDPTYCAIGESDNASQNADIIMRKMNEETCFLPFTNDTKRITAQKYNFVTEIFYLAHKCFQLGNRACIERLTHMTRELHNAQSAYEDAVNTDPNSELTQSMLSMLQEKLQRYLTIRNSLSEPEHDKNVLTFFEASAIWLTEIALRSEEDWAACLLIQEFAPKKILNKPIAFDTPSFVPEYLNSVPEFIIENIISYLHFVRHFSFSENIEIQQSAHGAIFRMILLFMGTSDYLKNPHLRAKLAEALEFFLPIPISGSKRTTFLTRIFHDHEDRLKIAQCLLNVFVSIEMTGQSVEFEQKFNYRRPMYAIIEYLWTKEEQVGCFRRLADEAETSIDAVQPPLFLRFINLLINDAIFLLDESLSNLQQIRQLQQTQTSSEWASLPQSERQQHIANLQHLGALTRFDNILSRDTINTLKLLTSEIRSIFCHNSMVDRIASMLNYFLLHLVGPEKDKLKVHNRKEFEFDPAKIVLGICHIYINLGNNDDFCRAVSQDGRSYSPDLFTYAEGILVRIGGGQLIGELIEFAQKVKKIETIYKEDQELLSDAPEEYLDPLMSTLMTDPVILPSSKVTVDRSTIARHLLSDQTDPFNREPLTMDKVNANENLRNEIQNWIQERRSIARCQKKPSTT